MGLIQDMKDARKLFTTGDHYDLQLHFYYTVCKKPIILLKLHSPKEKPGNFSDSIMEKCSL